jgi:creatinine amidohydrolase/Fe(II)-dependent formamide hydrolase-like protein
MNTPAKKEGIASFSSSHLISLNADIIIIPTTMRAGAVAAAGTSPATGARNTQANRSTAVTTLVRPVRPPTLIPAALSTYVVVLDVPNKAPTEVAIASANRALSILDLKPLLVSMRRISSSVNMPLCRPVPIKVPMVSKVSARLKEKMVTSTRGSFDGSENRDPNPSDPRAAPKVIPRSAKAEPRPVVVPMLFLGPDRIINKGDTSYYGMDVLSFDEGESQQLEGTAYYINKDEFCMLLDAVMFNLSRAGFKVVVGHGHGPSTITFSERKQVFKDKFGLSTYTLFDLGYTGEDGIQTDHAAANETSLVMAIRPELVSMEKLSEDDIPIGVWGKDPRKAASAARGNAIIEKNVRLACQKLVSIVSDIPKSERKLEYRNVKSLLG